MLTKCFRGTDFDAVKSDALQWITENAVPFLRLRTKKNGDEFVVTVEWEESQCAS